VDAGILIKIAHRQRKSISLLNPSVPFWGLFLGVQVTMYSKRQRVEGRRQKAKD
jgi:hypothetical protein